LAPFLIKHRKHGLNKTTTTWKLNQWQNTLPSVIIKFSLSKQREALAQVLLDGGDSRGEVAPEQHSGETEAPQAGRGF